MSRSQSQRISEEEEEDSSGLGLGLAIAGVIIGGLGAFIGYKYDNYEKERNKAHKQCPNEWSSSFLELIIDLKEGDLIEFRRPTYQHWAIYIGDWKVVHLNNDGFVKIDDIDEVAGSYPCRINLLEVEAKKRGLVRRGTGKEIASYAKKLVAEKVGYCVLSSNCEHFVTHVLYKEPFSTQQEILNKNMTIQIFAKAGSSLMPFE